MIKSSSAPVEPTASWHGWVGRGGPILLGLGRLMRLSNSLPAATLVLLGAKLVSGWPLSGRAWLAAAAMWSISAYGYVSNDLCDVAEDRINKPNRPLVSGQIGQRTSIALCSILAISGVLLAWLLGWREMVVALVVLGLLSFYNLRLKSTPGAGNLLVAILAGCTLLTGGIAVRGFVWVAVTPVMPAAALLTAFIVARELLKTLEDVAGDRAVAKQTLAVTYGEKAVVRIVGGLALLVGILSVMPVIFFGYSPWFLLLVQLGVQAPLLFTTGYLWATPTAPRVTRSLRWLKASYFVGLLALLVA